MANVTLQSIAARTHAQLISDGRHTLVADESLGDGGDDLGPGPYELLLSALGACTAITLQMYARRKQWPLDDVAIALTHEKLPPERWDELTPAERAEAETNGRFDDIGSELTLTGNLTAEQRDRLLEIANRCPVRRTLESRPRIVSSLA